LLLTKSFEFKEIVQKFDGARVDELFRTIEEQVVRNSFNLNINDNSGQPIVSEFGFERNFFSII